MGKAITYKEVQKGRAEGEAGEIWRKIGEITGAGHVPGSDEASIDITDISDAKQKRIDSLLAPADEPKEAEAEDSTKRGKK